MRLKNMDGSTWRGIMYQSPCWCCGMSYTDKVGKKVNLTAPNGIRVINGDVSPDKEFETTTGTKKKIVKNVKTKNGVLTVITMHLLPTPKEEWVEV